ncbi:MAG: hypothetical protein BGO67_12225 [Alphaproteobacteria bacterium 41-28]|nr:MAG: hypothetical protein BGO67_12225 [Alphaproteobacteria bacterium 41-28]
MLHKLPLTGIDFLLKDEKLLYHLAKKRIGILTNQSALTRDYKPTAQALSERLRAALTCILTPEHGWSGFIPEGVKVSDGFDSQLGLPIFSLYGMRQKSLHEIDIDTLIIDLQDVGLRCYTYTATCAKVLEACAGSSLEIIVCDRPNPLGPKQKGPALDPHYRSFVGYLDVPFQHGQTIGELLSTYNQPLKLPLTVIPCQHDHKPYEYPWIPPSPNLPSWDSVLLYPALVFLEGTNISEGRGTSLPFTCLGAPGLDHQKLVDFINRMDGIHARPILFTPQSGDLRGKECQGAHLFITDLNKLDSFSSGLKILEFLKRNYSPFEWTEMLDNQRGYFIDYLLGTDSYRKQLEVEILPGSPLAIL